jgi:hypothetical protein
MWRSADLEIRSYEIWGNGELGLVGSGDPPRTWPCYTRDL